MIHTLNMVCLGVAELAYRNLNLSFPAQSTRPEDKDVLRCPYLSGIQARRHPDIRKTWLSSTNPHPLLLQLNYIMISWCWLINRAGNSNWSSRAAHMIKWETQA